MRPGAVNGNIEQPIAADSKRCIPTESIHNDTSPATARLTPYGNGSEVFHRTLRSPLSLDCLNRLCHWSCVVLALAVRNSVWRCCITVHHRRSLRVRVHRCRQRTSDPRTTVKLAGSTERDHNTTPVLPENAVTTLAFDTNTLHVPSSTSSCGEGVTDHRETRVVGRKTIVRGQVVDNAIAVNGLQSPRKATTPPRFASDAVQRQDPWGQAVHHAIGPHAAYCCANRHVECSAYNAQGSAPKSRIARFCLQAGSSMALRWGFVWVWA
jgi:hypothetical protein